MCKGIFRKTVAGYTGKDLMQKVNSLTNSNIALFISVPFFPKYEPINIQVSKYPHCFSILNELTNVTYKMQSATATKIHDLLNSFQVLNDLVGFKLGQIEVYTIPGNYCQVNSLLH